MPRAVAATSSPAGDLLGRIIDEVSLLTNPTSRRPARQIVAGDGCDCLGRNVFAGAATVEPRATAAAGGLGPFIAEHRAAILRMVVTGLMAAVLVVVVPRLAGLEETMRRVQNGDERWLLLGATLQSLSIGGYVALFHAMFGTEARIGWAASSQIVLAASAATKLFATAGAGGIALTAWALTSAGLSRSRVVHGIAGLQVVLYAIYMAALAIVGTALAFGASSVSAPWTVTLLPAVFGATVIALAVSFRFRFRAARGVVPIARSRRQRLSRRMSAIPQAVHGGILSATALVREPRLGLLGAPVYWMLDIATLWAAFRAFGDAPAAAILVMGYYVGLLANTIPLPGGIGGVEGGMIGAFLAFGVDPATVVLAVLAYRLLSFWLPTVPGVIAYLRLRRTMAEWHASDADGAARGAANPAPG